jgi:hypothetical protein
VSNNAETAEIPMGTRPISLLESFHQFVGQQLASATAEPMSPEQALALWRERQDSLAAIREGLADIEAGRFKTLEEFDRDFRQRHGLDDVT